MSPPSHGQLARDWSVCSLLNSSNDDFEISGSSYLFLQSIYYFVKFSLPFRIENEGCLLALFHESMSQIATSLLFPDFVVIGIHSLFLACNFIWQMEIKILHNI